MIASLDLKRKQRFDFMSCLYDRTDGTESGLVEIELIAKELTLSEGETLLIAQYLAAEGLIRLRLQHIVSITHSGIVEVEAALRKPDIGTEHFPSLQSVNSNGTAGSGTRAESRNGLLPVLRATDVALLRPFLASLEMQASKLGLDHEATSELRADISTARLQLSSPTPKPQIVTICLRSLLAAVERAGVSTLSSDLKAQIPSVRALLERLNLGRNLTPDSAP